MQSRDPDQKKPVNEQAKPTIAQKVEALQERVRKMGAAWDGSNDKAFMDETWGGKTVEPACFQSAAL